jgi:ApaG protein
MDREYAQLTRGINVRVASFYLEDQSEPEAGRYVWAYRVTIENRGDTTVQLLRRSWRITDARGRIFLVEGDGVVGEQPVLEPGEAFEYTSGTPLETPSGFMTGQYHMIVHGRGPAVAAAGAAGEAFDVAIPPFSLDSPHQPGRVH